MSHSQKEKSIRTRTRDKEGVDVVCEVTYGVSLFGGVKGGWSHVTGTSWGCPTPTTPTTSTTAVTGPP